MARGLALLSLILAGVALPAVAAVALGRWPLDDAGAQRATPARSEQRTERRRRTPLPGADEVYPGLRTFAALSQPGERTQTSAVGVYPALNRPERLVFPRPGSVQAARAFAETREGRVSFAVADSRGGVVGDRLRERYASASLVKAMLLVAWLERLDGEDKPIGPSDKLLMDAMIRVSDNDAASELYSRLGSREIRRLGRRAGMRDFTIGKHWGDARVTPLDQARFFLSLDRFLPDRFRDYARNLLQSVEPLQSWGVPAAARPRWKVLFKGGWRPERPGHIVHQAALLEQGNRRLAIAVLSDGNPDQPYGHRTVEGVAQRLLAPPGSALPPPVLPGRLASLPSLARYGGSKPRPLRPLSRK